MCRNPDSQFQRMHKKLDKVLYDHIYFNHPCHHHKCCDDISESENEDQNEVQEPKTKKQKVENEQDLEQFDCKSFIEDDIDLEIKS